MELTKAKGSLTYLIWVVEREFPCTKWADLGYITYSILHNYCKWHDLECSRANFKAIIKALDPEYGDDIIDSDWLKYHEKES